MEVIVPCEDLKCVQVLIGEDKVKMESENLQVLRLHENPQYLKPCCELINDEWPRSETARMMSLQASCNHLPTSLILINDMKHLLGHCKLTPIPSIPESCFIETVVISKAMRGKKLGSYLMRQVEEYCKNMLKLRMLHLSTKGQENFYSKLGYEVCAPVSIYGIRSFNSEPTDFSNKIQNPVPINSDTPAGPPPPPPPPMPKPDSLVNNSTLKSSKTFMFKNNYAAAYRSKQTTRVVEYHCQASSSKSRAAPAKAPRKAPAPKKTVSQVTKPQTRKPSVKQLQDKVNSQTKKIDQIKKQLNDVKKLVQTNKKAGPKQNNNKQPIVVDRKIVIRDSYY